MGAQDRPGFYKWIIAFTVMLPCFIEIVDTSVVNVSLDHIRGSLSAGIDEATWTMTSYLVSNAIIIPMTGWLSRLMGRKVYLILSISIFTVSSLLCGLSWNLQSLVFFRVMQGIGGGALQPLSQAILIESFPDRTDGNGHGHLRHGGNHRAHYRAHARRVDHGQLVLALDILHKHSYRRHRGHHGLFLHRRSPLHEEGKDENRYVGSLPCS